MDFDFEFGGSAPLRRLDQHQREIASSSASLADAQTEISRLLIENHKLKIAVNATIAAMVEAKVVTEERFQQLLTAAEGDAASHDGRSVCGGCGRLLRAVNKRCIYCGHPHEPL